MKIIRSIITINFLFILLLIQNANAQYPTSTPETIDPIDFNFTESIKDALLGSTNSTTPAETGGGVENMASGSSASSSFTTITWTGGGADELASTAANWSGNVAPQSGDEAVFNGTSSKNCTWDLNIILSSLNINPGYAGKITLEASLTISDEFIKFIWTGMGEDNLASNPANWSKNAVPEDGDEVVFTGGFLNNCVWDISVSLSSLIMETAYTGTVTLNNALSLSENLNISGGTLTLTGHDLNVEGYLLIAEGATLNASNSTITVRGDWLNRGNFNCGQSTVIMNGTGQSIYGDTVFYDLEKISACPKDTLYFEAGSLQTILGRLMLTGGSGCLLALRSTVEGSQWYIDPQGTRNISFTSIKDMNNINFVDIIAMNSINAGGNGPGVKFGGSQCVCLEEKRILARVLCREGMGGCI